MILNWIIDKLQEIIIKFHNNTFVRPCDLTTAISGDTSVVVLFVYVLKSKCCLNLMYVFIVLVKFGLLRGRILGNSRSLGFLIAPFPDHCLLVPFYTS